MSIRRFLLVLLGPLPVVASIGSTGCVSLGPKTIGPDRIDYATGITESWKRQTLLNIVKLRYADPPIFVDVGQIVAGYSLETSVSLGATDTDSPVGKGNALSLGASGRLTDRPTITYVPMTGSRFVNGLITPIAPASLFSAIQAGWPADQIVRLGVGAINGIANEQLAPGSYVPADPRFGRVIELMRSLQLSGSISIRVNRSADGNTATLFALRGDETSPDDVAAARELRALLRLEPGTNEFSLVYARQAANGHEIAVQSRSLFNVLQMMAAQTLVPDDHVREGRATGTPNHDEISLPGFRILSSSDKPDTTYAALSYRSTWFYIADTDLPSKRIFALVMLLFTLADTSADRSQPMLTIPVQ
jgi:hypothetical protein